MEYHQWSFYFENWQADFKNYSEMQETQKSRNNFNKEEERGLTLI